MPVRHGANAITKVFKYRLYPTPAQTKRLEQALETCRLFYNYLLQTRTYAHRQRGKSLGKFDLYKLIAPNRAESDYLQALPVGTLRELADDLDGAFQAFFKRAKRGDEKKGYPKFKARRNFNSLGYKDMSGAKIDGRRLKLFAIGRVRVRWHRPLPGEPVNARLVREGKHWFVCFDVRVGSSPLVPTGRSVGIDMGLRYFAVTSDGEVIENPRWLSAAERRLRVLNRRLSRRALGSRGWKSAKNKLNQLYRRVARQRVDFVNKLAARLIKQYDTIVLEDLKIKNMVAHPQLGKSIRDAAWGLFRQTLENKARETWRKLELVNPAYTSQTCSQCGASLGLTLKDRWVQCASCGLSLDRDHNAALNILKRAGIARTALTKADTL